MVKNHGYRVKTRSIFRKKVRTRGMKGINRFLINYEVGDQVDIIADPAYQKRGMPHKRFHGKTGTIVDIRGRCYVINVKDINKMKTIICGKEHLRKNKYYEMQKAASN